MKKEWYRGYELKDSCNPIIPKLVVCGLVGFIISF